MPTHVKIRMSIKRALAATSRALADPRTATLVRLVDLVVSATQGW